MTKIAVFIAEERLVEFGMKDLENIKEKEKINTEKRT